MVSGTAMIGAASSSGAEGHAAAGLTLEHAINVTQRFVAAGLIALVIGLARLVHRFGDRLRLLGGEIPRFLFGAGDRPRRRLAVHGGEGRLGLGAPWGGGGIQGLGAPRAGLIARCAASR